jgi:hypothetical protein
LKPETTNPRSDSADELDVFGHNGDVLGMDVANIRVLKEGDKICLHPLINLVNSTDKRTIVVNMRIAQMAIRSWNQKENNVD